MINGILLERLSILDNKIDVIDQKISELMECGQSHLCETVKKTTLEIRRDEIIDVLDNIQKKD